MERCEPWKKKFRNEKSHQASLMSSLNDEPLKLQDFLWAMMLSFFPDSSGILRTLNISLQNVHRLRSSISIHVN